MKKKDEKIITLSANDFERLSNAEKEKQKIEREYIETVAKLILSKHKYAFEVLGQ